MKSSKNVLRLKGLGWLVAFVAGIGIGGITPASASAETNWLTEDVSKGIFSIGGRAMYFDPEDGKNHWFGGAQVRAHLGDIFAIEGSADYRKNDFGDTTVHTYPVQVSALAYLLPGKRISPFLLGGGGWYYTTIDGPNGFDDTDNRFGLHAGGGLQFMMTERWSVDGSYRYVWTEDIKSRDRSLRKKDFSDEGHMVTVGLNFHF
jgi:opacity protein-like surface antigen